MKRTAIILGCFALTAFMLGCDESTFSNLSPEVQAMITSYTGLKTDAAARPVGYGTQDQLRDRDQLQLHLQDGTCDNDGNQYGGSNGNGGNGTGPGDGTGTGPGSGTGDQLRLRDGSCGD